MDTAREGLSPQSYREILVERFWEYSRSKFSPFENHFDQPSPSADRPPVFMEEHASRNVLTRDGISGPAVTEALNAIPETKRHKWFRSMASSQALAQSVFGNLLAYRKLDCLRGLVGDDGRPLFIQEPSHGNACQLEFEVNYLGEKSRGLTSVDVLFDGSYRIAVECKLAETEIGSCSRPRLRPGDPSYQAQYCDGRYAVQKGRKSRCSLSEVGVEYWKYVPELFDWRTDTDLDPCPLNFSYQLVRNLLAMCVSRTGRPSLDSGHVVLLYDDRNPAFLRNGKGITAWNSVRAGLKKQSLMQKCTWQKIVTRIRTDASLDWLTSALSEKYGFC